MSENSEVYNEQQHTINNIHFTMKKFKCEFICTNVMSIFFYQKQHWKKDCMWYKCIEVTLKNDSFFIYGRHDDRFRREKKYYFNITNNDVTRYEGRQRNKMKFFSFEIFREHGGAAYSYLALFILNPISSKNFHSAKIHCSSLIMMNRRASRASA